ncbi:MAG: DoxX family protein [Leptospirales bacterium]|nr:DoxX family protein [Leptospirales bacterium]
MKIAVIVIRSLMGALLLFGSVAYFLKLFPTPELTGGTKIFMAGMDAVVYLMPLVKATELACGLALLVGRFVPLATVVLAPVVLNIVLYHAFLDPATIGAGVFLLVGGLFLAYAHRSHFKSLLAMKATLG